jgi:hypothetical protein
LQSTKEISAFTFSPSSMGSTMRKSPVGNKNKASPTCNGESQGHRKWFCLLEGCLSPLLIQIFFRYLEGMLTKKRCPWAVSTSCRLFPGVLSTWARKEQNQSTSPVKSNTSDLHCTLPPPQRYSGRTEGGRAAWPNVTYPHNLLLVRGYHVLPQHLLHHMLPLGGLRHAECSPGWLGIQILSASPPEFFGWQSQKPGLL